jgi:hypothetical protein
VAYSTVDIPPSTIKNSTVPTARKFCGVTQKSVAAIDAMRTVLESVHAGHIVSGVI